MAGRGIAVDHVTVDRWVRTFTSESSTLRAPLGVRRSLVRRRDYVKVAGRWTYLYRAVDQHGQVIDVLLCERRDRAAARALLTRALRVGSVPAEITTDRAPVYLRVIDELTPGARHVLEQ